MTAKELCILCKHSCCRWVGLTTTKMSMPSIEHYLARGCKILKADIQDSTVYRIYVPFTCPHLIEGEGCGIYDERPEICVEYQGEHDPIVQDVCLIKEVEDGETPN